MVRINHSILKGGVKMISAKIKNFDSPRSGRPVANQFIIEEIGGILGNFIKRETFQSYNSIIAIRTIWRDGQVIELDETYWDYSRTTGKYRNEFLGENTAETRKKIKKGEYKLADLN